MSNLSDLLGQPNFEFVKHDVSNPFEIDVDRIFNFACPASPVKYQLDPVGTVKTIVQGAINMLNLAKKTGTRILQASTSEIYGDPEVHPQEESYWGRVNPIGVRSCYDEGKRCAETMFFDYWRQYRVEIKVARIFNTYGPKMQPDDGRAVPNFVVQALAGEDISVYGSGEQTRSFCYVDDLIAGIIKFMETDRSIIGPINLGNPFELTVTQLAEKIVELTGSKSKIVYKELPLDDPRKRKPNIELASRQLGWVPKIALDEGLRKTIDYFIAQK
jgi:UDP-glucuronate decarboxylase